MAFPTNPSPGDSYTDEYGTVWIYAGTVNGWYRQTVTTPNDTSYTATISGPAGSNTQVQFNDNGELAGDSGLTYNKTTDALSGGAFIPTGNTVPSNGLYLPSDNNVALSTNGTGRLFVDSSGNVGVGGAATITASTTTLQITNAISTARMLLESTGTGGRKYGLYTSVDGQFAVYDYTAGSERLRITSAGNVGIGTTSPVDTLQINKNATNASSGGLTLKSADSNESLLSFGVSTSLGKACITSSKNGSGTVLPIAFAVGPSSTNERMRIDSSGRLLVGTSSDSGGALLQVNGNRIRVATAKTPASASDTGTTGEICWDASYIYVCTATNTWKRAALSTW